MFVHLCPNTLDQLAHFYKTLYVRYHSSISFHILIFSTPPSILTITRQPSKYPIWEYH